MASKRISQREARRLQKEVERLRGQITLQRKVWGQDYMGAEISRCIYEPTALAVRVARKLNHAVVVVGDDTNLIRFVALPHPSEDI